MKNVFALVLMTVLISALTVTTHGANRFARASGDWNSPDIWAPSAHGRTGKSVPVAGDHVTINNGVTVIVTAGAACATLTFGDDDGAAVVSIHPGITLDVCGAVTLPRANSGINSLNVGAGFLNAGSIAFTNGGGTNRHQVTISTGTASICGNVSQKGSSGSATIAFTGPGRFRVGGTFLTPATGTVLPAGDCTVEYKGAAQTVEAFSYANLALSGSGVKTMAAATTIGGVLSIGAGTSINLGTFMHMADQLSLGGVGQTATGYWGSTASTASNKNATYFGTTATGRVLIAAALPVELTSFTASVTKGCVTLNWKTAAEVNNYGFEVEKNVNGAWNKMGFVPGAGTTNAPQQYSFIDNTASAGKSSYRLKQVDRDGAYEYSSSIEVTNAVAPAEFSLGNYPNPFNPSTTVTFSVPANGETTLKVFNVMGQEVATLFNGAAEAGKAYEAQFSATNLSTGLYFSRLENNGSMLISKMLLVK